MTRPTILQVNGANAFDLGELIGRCFEAQAHAVLFEEGALPRAFFDLSTGLAGEVVQKMANYQVRMAVVVADLQSCSDSFRAFAREAARGSSLRFFETLDGARAWLDGSAIA